MLRCVWALAGVAAVGTGAAQAAFFGEDAYGNGDWHAAAGALGDIINIPLGLNLGALAAGVPEDLGMGVSALANGPDVFNDTLGFSITLGATTTEFTLTFEEPIRAIALDISNGNVTNGITLDTGLATYPLEALNGSSIAGFIGIVEPAHFDTITFRVTNPAGATELFFLDGPMRVVVPAPGAAGVLAAGVLALARRRR